MAITSVTKDTDAISYVEDGVTKKLSITGSDIVISFPPDSMDRVVNMYRQQSDGHVIISYFDTSDILQTIDVDPSGGVDTSGTPVANDIARFTDADTIEGRSYAELKADLNLEIGTDVLAEQTIGIADNNLVEIDHASVADDDYAKFTANGLEGRSYAEVLSDLAAVVGPASAVDNAIARYHLTTGKIIQGYTGNDPTVTDAGLIQGNGGVNLPDAIDLSFGTGVDVEIQYAIADTDARILHVAFKPGADAGDNACIALLDDTTAKGQDLGLFSAYADDDEHRYWAVLDKDRDSVIMFGFAADDDAQIVLVGSAALTLPAFTAGGAIAMGGNAITGHAQAITDNVLATVDGSPNNAEVTVWTANGLDGKTYAEFHALQFAANLPEDVAIKIDAALSADGKYCAILAVSGTAGYGSTYGDCVYFAVADSKWELAKGDAEATVSPMTGIVIVAGVEDAAITVCIIGEVRADAAFPTLTVGAPVFIDPDTAGDVSSTELTTGEFQKALGWATTANSILLTGNPDWVKVG